LAGYVLTGDSGIRANSAQWPKVSEGLLAYLLFLGNAVVRLMRHGVSCSFRRYPTPRSPDSSASTGAKWPVMRAWHPAPLTAVPWSGNKASARPERLLRFRRCLRSRARRCIMGFGTKPPIVH